MTIIRPPPASGGGRIRFRGRSSRPLARCCCQRVSARAADGTEALVAGVDRPAAVPGSSRQRDDEQRAHSNVAAGGFTSRPPHLHPSVRQLLRRTFSFRSRQAGQVGSLLRPGVPAASRSRGHRYVPAASGTDRLRSVLTGLTAWVMKLDDHPYRDLIPDVCAGWRERMAGWLQDGAGRGGGEPARVTTSVRWPSVIES